MTPAHLILEEHRVDGDVARRCFPETRSDLDVVVGDVADDDRLPLRGALTDQAFAQREAVGEVLALGVGVGAGELERRRALRPAR